MAGQKKCRIMFLIIKFYKFPDFERNHSIESVHPLLGLDEESVAGAITEFNPSDEFVKTVIERGKIVD